MKIISWNVNGIRAAVQKGFLDFLKETDADIFCVQETKLQDGQFLHTLPEGYLGYWNYAEKKGYSGTAVFTKKQPLNILYGLGLDEHDKEGRVLTLEFDNFYLTNLYTPNSQSELARLDYRLLWEDAFRNFVDNLQKKKPVIICGDFNVAHEYIDLKRPEDYTGSTGFSTEEREKFSQLLDSGFIDTFRYLHPDEPKYSWWSYQMMARRRNDGWRLDYILISSILSKDLETAEIYSDILGSDHAPIGVTLKKIFNP